MIRKKILQWIAGKLKPFMGIEKSITQVEVDTRSLVHNTYSKRCIRIKNVEELAEATKKRMDMMEDDFKKFGSFLSELIDMSRSQYKGKDIQNLSFHNGQEETIKNLTRKFFAK